MFITYRGCIINLNKIRYITYKLNDNKRYVINFVFDERYNNYTQMCSFGTEEECLKDLERLQRLIQLAEQGRH